VTASKGDVRQPQLTVLPWGRSAFAVTISALDGRRVIHVSGELDLSTRDVIHGACVVDGGHDVTVDLRAITFLDCSGYSGLVEARRELESRGGSLVVSDPVGQPARLLAILTAGDHVDIAV
jgi:anti-sigma B factor antagonist